MGSSKVEIIFSDVDGTFLDTQHKVRPDTKLVYEEALRSPVPVVFATGRSSKSVEKAILGQLPEGRLYPGVYSQGLVVHGPNGADDIVYEAILDPQVVRQGISFWLDHPKKDKFSWIFYHRADMYCHDVGPLVQDITTYGEAMPTMLPTEVTSCDHMTINKMIISCESAAMAAQIRKDLEALYGEAVAFTAAIAHQVEVLPPGCSKGLGVAKLLERLGIQPLHAMALGDAENDLEMLRVVGHPIAMGNACAALKNVPNVTVARRNDAGGWAVAVAPVIAAAAGGAPGGDENAPTKLQEKAGKPGIAAVGA